MKSHRRLTAVVGAALLVASCGVAASSDTGAPPTLETRAVTSTAAPDAEVTTTLVMSAPDPAVATTLPAAPPDTVTTPTTAASAEAQGLPATVPPTVAARLGSGDLGLDQRITELECDGQFVTLVGVATDPARYREVVSYLLATNPGSNYARTEYACSSLIARLADGTAVYIVFHGPFDTIRQACTALARGPADAYVKVLRNIPPPESRVDC